MNTATTTSATPSPAPHPLFHDSAEARRFVEQESDKASRARWDKTLADVLVGRALIKVRHDHPFPDERYGSFEQWAKDRVGYGQGQRDRLLSAGRLDPARVKNRKIPLQKTATVGSQPAWLHQTLLDLCDGTPAATLAWAGDSAVEHLKRHADPEAACDHARAVAAGAEAPLVKEPRRDSTHTLVKWLGGPFKRVLDVGGRLLARTSGQPLPEGSPERERLQSILVQAGPTLVKLFFLAGLELPDSPRGLTPEAPAADSPGGLTPEAPPAADRRAQDRQEAPGPDPSEEQGPDAGNSPAPTGPCGAAAPCQGAAIDTEDPEEEAEETEEAPAPYQPPSRPYIDPQAEALLPIYVYPSLLPDMTRAERLACRLLCFGDSLSGLLTEFLHRRMKLYEQVFLDLQLLVRPPLEESLDLLDLLLPLLQPAIDNARTAELPDGGEPEEPADLLYEWVVHDNSDPLHEPDPNDSERLLWTVLGQLPLFIKDLGELLTLREQGGEEAALDLRLLRRFGDLLPPLRHLVLKSSCNVAKGAHQAYRAQLADAEQQAALEAVQGPRESRIIVVGAEALPPAHGFIGKTLDDRLVTWNLWEPSLTLLLGDRGKGKSHFIRVLIELLTLRPEGLAYLKRPQCAILIDAECTQGEGRFEMLEGFFSNHDTEQLHHLHQFYRTEARNLAFKRAVLLCHRQQVEEYKELLAPYVERGLCIRPLGLGISDLGSFAFEVMLEWAVGGDQTAVYKNLISSLVARHGEHLTLRLLQQAVQGSSLRGHTKQTVVELFDLLGGLYSETESVMQHVGEYPVFTLLRGRYLPKNFVNPMQAVLFNAFCRSAQNGDPPRVVIFEEYAKAMSRNRAMQRFSMNFAEELRHRPVSAVGGLQHLEGLGKGLWAAADQHVVFGLSNPQDVRKAKAELYGMRHLRFAEMEAHGMPAGRARIFARRGNVPELSRGLLVDIRPTLICAGGRTLNAGDDEGEE